MSVNGSVELVQIEYPKPGAPPSWAAILGPDPPCVLQTGFRNFDDERVDGNWDKPDDKRLSCVIATRRGQLARVMMKVNLDVKQIDAGYKSPVCCSFKNQEILAENVSTVYSCQENPAGASMYFNMKFNLKWEELPWESNP
jgi:hypothetical protein